ncbi:MAG: endonuclease III domain-containing protein [Promethearchaeota archaeon]
MNFSEKDYNLIREKILNWYKRHKNNYPWRNTRNLYKILITEILLQKTTATNVSKIFNNFFKKYNNFSIILKVNIEELESDIKSLGLSNKRAKTLKDLSKMIINEYNNKIPQDYEILKKIKGIGDYVSNAYLCFGLNYRTIFIDINIKRIILRIFEYPNKKLKLVSIKKYLNQILPEKDYKHFYWALLDFGNKICTSKSPNCNNCPLTMICKYYSWRL